MSRIGWYLQRMRAMDPAEVAWRASTLVRTAAGELAPRPAPRLAELVDGGPARDPEVLLKRFRAGTGRPVLLDADRAAVLAERHPDEAAAVIRAADRVAENRFTFFGRTETRLPDPIDWHHDVATGVDWPATPASRINHRTHGGDAKWIWELNRLQHLPWLAQGWLLTGDQHYADIALAHLGSWLDHNPPGVGIAWRGAFEAGVRATSVAVALQGLRDAPGLTPELFGRAVVMLAESARRCWRDRSRFSSANNHLVGELGGLLTVALLFPELAAAPAWERRGLAALTAQHRQIFPDGAGAEQSVGYQVYTADVFCLVVALLRLRGDEAPAPLVDAVHRSGRFLGELVRGVERVPRYGDDDGSFALRLDAAPLREVSAHLTTVAAVLGTPLPEAAGGGLVAGWLAPAHECPAPDDDHETEPPASGFHAPHGGVVVLRADRRRLTMDVGPLGYLSIAAHGHADALAITLVQDGLEVITDPGTGSYYGHPGWRDDHRGTRMHATVSVDGLDQSVAGGMFLWTRHAAVETRLVDLAAGTVCAEHDGYARLSRPVIHRRWLWASPGASDVVVVDLIDGAGDHIAETNWPLHPDLDVVTCGAGFEILRSGRPVLGVVAGGSAPVEVRAVRGEPHGDDDGPGGWWSAHLDQRIPAWRIGHLVRTAGPTVVATVLADLRDGGARPTHVEVGVGAGTASVVWPGACGHHRLDLNLTGRTPIVHTAPAAPAPDRPERGSQPCAGS